MSTDSNPYAAPNASLSVRASLSTGEVGAAFIEPLMRARPWLLLLSEILWLVFLGLLIASVSYAMGRAGEHTVVIGFRRAYALTYLLGATCLAQPALRAWRTCAAIRALTQSKSVGHLRAVLEIQRSFWSALGIGLALFVVMAPVLLIFGPLLFAKR